MYSLTSYAVPRKQHIQSCYANIAGSRVSIGATRARYSVHIGAAPPFWLWNNKVLERCLQNYNSSDCPLVQKLEFFRFSLLSSKKSAALQPSSTTLAQNRILLRTCLAATHSLPDPIISRLLTVAHPVLWRQVRMRS